ncbi:sialin [Ixodes scapularis]
MRVNLNVALVAMVNHTAVQENTVPSDCPLPSAGGNETSAVLKDGPFAWDPVAQGVVLGAFFYGYIVTPIPGGRMAERFGAKWLFGLGTLFTGLLSLAIPSAAYAGQGYLVAVRVLQGIGEGVTYPAIEAQVAHWIPVNQRATAVSLIHTGGFFGVAVGMYISGLLSSTDFLGGWPSVFYVFGIWTCFWFLLWALFTSNTPADHHWASAREVCMIEADLGDQKPTLARRTPWLKIFTSLPVFGVVMAHFGTHWLQYVLVSELPTYLGTVLHYDIDDNTLQQWSYCFYISGVVGLVTGLCFQLFASAEVQDWGLERSDDAPATEVSELKSIKNTIPKEVNGPASYNGHPRTSL